MIALGFGGLHLEEQRHDTASMLFFIGEWAYTEVLAEGTDNFPSDKMRISLCLAAADGRPSVLLLYRKSIYLAKNIMEVIGIWEFTIESFALLRVTLCLE